MFLSLVIMNYRNNAYIDSLQGPKVITWNHLYYHMPNQLVYTGTESVSAVMGTLRTTKEVFKRALEELTIDSIETVLDLMYQPCAYGILIHSMWGEESEDKVFEEYKRINNLML